jgi:TolA-binding protein
MAEYADVPEPSDITDASLPETELETDFLSDLAEDAPIEPVVLPDMAPDAEPPEAAAEAEPEAEPEPESGPVHTPVFPVIIGAAFVGVLALSAVLNLEMAPSPKAAASTTEPASAVPADEPAKEAGVKALAGNVDGLKTEVASLSKHIQAMQSQLEGLAKIDLAPLQGKVADLAKSAEKVALLPQKVSALDGRLGTMDQALQRGLGSVRDELIALKSDLKQVGETADKAAKLAGSTSTAVPVSAPSSTSPSSTTPAASPAPKDTTSEVVDLFKAGKYKEASEAFRTIEPSDPKDARVWYYAAMSNGMATNEWKGETERLLKKGIEREAAETPKSSDIDAEFAKLAPARLKTWFDYYRKNLSK